MQDGIIDLEQGQIIFKQGDTGQVMYVLISGKIQIKRQFHNGDIESSVINKPNDFFGEMALIDGQPRSATAIALEASKVFQVDSSTFESMILANSKFALKMIKILTARIRKTGERTE